MKVTAGKEESKYLQGRLSFKKKKYKKAIKLYKERLAADPYSVHLLYEMALAYAELENHDEAFKYWKKLLKVAPTSFLVDKINQKLKKTRKE